MTANLDPEWVAGVKGRAERVLDGTQTGAYTKRRIVRDLLEAIDALASATKALQRIAFSDASDADLRDLALDELHKQGYMSMGRSTP